MKKPAISQQRWRRIADHCIQHLPQFFKTWAFGMRIMHLATCRFEEVPMSAPIQTRVYATRDGRAVIEQSQSSVVVLSAEQILKVIDELRACYDYCAAWKASAQGPDHEVQTGIPP